MTTHGSSPPSRTPVRIPRCDCPSNGAGKKRFIKQLYVGLARRYDLVNHIISWGQDRRWRKQAAARLPAVGWLVDLGGGTGEMTLAYVRARHALGRVVLVDFSRAMLQKARHKISRAVPHGRVHFVLADVERLPFDAHVFSGAMSAFVLRNLPSIGGVACESRRVLCSGGQVVFLDATRPPRGWRRMLFDSYFQWFMPKLAAVFHPGSGRAYRYLAASVREFPPPDEVVQHLRRAGFATGESYALAGGMATLFCASVDGRTP